MVQGKKSQSQHTGRNVTYAASACSMKQQRALRGHSSGDTQNGHTADAAIEGCRDADAQHCRPCS